MKVIGFASDDGNVGQLTSDETRAVTKRLRRGANMRGPDFPYVTCASVLTPPCVPNPRGRPLQTRQPTNRASGDVFASRNSQLTARVFCRLFVAACDRDGQQTTTEREVGIKEETTAASRSSRSNSQRGTPITCEKSNQKEALRRWEMQIIHTPPPTLRKISGFGKFASFSARNLRNRCRPTRRKRAGARTSADSARARSLRWVRKD